MKRYLCKSDVTGIVYETFNTFEAARRYAYIFGLMIIDTVTGERVY